MENNYDAMNEIYFGAAVRKAKAYTDEAVENVKEGISFVDSVEDLPLVGDPKTIYYVSTPTSATDGVYDIYVWNKDTSAYVYRGTTQIDLDDYATDEELDARVAPLEELADNFSVEDGKLCYVVSEGNSDSGEFMTSYEDLNQLMTKNTGIGLSENGDLMTELSQAGSVSVFIKTGYSNNPYLARFYANDGTSSISSENIVITESISSIEIVNTSNVNIRVKFYSKNASDLWDGFVTDPALQNYLIPANSMATVEYAGVYLDGEFFDNLYRNKPLALDETLQDLVAAVEQIADNVSTVVESTVSTQVAEQLPAAVEDQISPIVEEQVVDQIDDVVAAKLPAEVTRQISTPVNQAVNTYCAANFAEWQGGLDSTLTNSSMAAPADKVGELKSAFGYVGGVEAVEWIVGGFDTATQKFNDSASFYHTAGFISIGQNILKCNPTPRFVVFYDADFNLTEWSSNTVDQTMVNRNSYCKLVPFATTFSSFTYEADKTVADVANISKNAKNKADANREGIKSIAYDAEFTLANGGWDTNTNSFDNNASYKHTENFLPIRQNVLSPVTNVRFAVFYDEDLNYVDLYNIATDGQSIPQSKINLYPYVKLVFSVANVPATIICDKSLKYAISKIKSIETDLESVISTVAPLKTYSNANDYEVGGFNTSTNQWNTSTQYYHSKDFISISDGVLAVNRTPRFVIFYDSNKQQTEYCQNEISYEMIQRNKYAKIVIFATDLDGVYVEADRIGGEIAKLVDVTSFNQQLAKYRYLTFAFGNQGKFGMFVLGTNDLQRFNCLNINRPFVSKKNDGVRDPAFLFYDGWFWFVYTPVNGLAIGPEMGLVRTKDFVTWEEFDNLIVTPSNGDDLSEGYTWAPDFFKEGNDIYIVVSCSTSTVTQNFRHRIMRFYPDTHSVGEAFTTNLSFIDAHIYKENSTYYALGAGGNLWKSDTLLSESWVKLNENNTGLHFDHYEAQFAVKLDNGKWRVFAQNVAGAIGNAFYYYQDSEGTTFESHFGDRVPITYDEATKAACAKKWSVTTGYFWHFTVYDRNWIPYNNNNFI